MARPSGNEVHRIRFLRRSSNSGPASRSVPSCSARTSAVPLVLKKASVQLERHAWAHSESIESDVTRWDRERPLFVYHDREIQTATHENF